MSWFVEPQLDEVFSDPMIQTVMERDQVNPERLREFLQDLGSSLARQTQELSAARDYALR